MTNNAATNGTELKTMGNSNLKHLCVMLVQIFKHQFTFEYQLFTN